MIKIAMYKDKQGRLLVIKQDINGDLIGEVYVNGVEKRGKWDMGMRALFRVKDKDATLYHVCKYFRHHYLCGFDYKNPYWKRWA